MADFLTTPGGIALTIVAQCLAVLGFVMVSLLFLVYGDRKIWAAVQMRRGPNVVGVFGLLQTVADALKYVVKEIVVPAGADKTVFFLAPLISFVLAMVAWAVIPFNDGWVLADINVAILFILAIGSLEVYGVIMGGWASNSKYPFLGALRSAAQMISYEVSIGFIIVNVCVCSGSFNLSNIVLAQQNIWFIIPLFPTFIMFYISMLAETNRHPFDLPEAEAELVSGYNVEYSAMTFALFFLGEYANMLLMSAFSSILFLGGWLSPMDVFPLNILPGSFWFSIKIAVGVIFFILTRATLPRYRYDQLMQIGWKCFLPLSLGYLIFTVGILISLNYLPFSLNFLKIKSSNVEPGENRLFKLYSNLTIISNLTSSGKVSKPSLRRS